MYIIIAELRGQGYQLPYMHSDAEVAAELHRIRTLENYASNTMFNNQNADPRTAMPGHAEIEVFAPQDGRTGAQT